MILINTLSKEKICNEIENLIITGADVIDAVLTVAKNYNISEDVIAKQLSPNIMEKIRQLAISNYAIKYEKDLSLADFDDNS